MNEQYKRFAEQCWDYDHNGMSTFDPMKFAHLVALHEREACAKLVDKFMYKEKTWYLKDIPSAIRARGEVK